MVAFAGILTCLVALAVTDVRHYILPDRLNALLAVLFVVFHMSTRWEFLTIQDAVMGAVMGGGFLLIIRAAAHRFYDEDALGLGDVKLMAAAGLGLGLPGVLLALSLGAGLGVLHGVALYLRQKRRGGDASFARVNVPAGLGLCIGIAIVMLISFHTVFT